MFTPHSASVKKEKKKKISLPTLPIFLGHVTGTRHTFLFGLIIFIYIPTSGSIILIVPAFASGLNKFYAF